MTLFPGIIYGPDDDAKGATFNPERTHRYRCWRTWNTDLPPLAWLMLNPSTADEKDLDPTLKRVRAFSIAWGFGGFEVWNLWSLRSTDPAGLWAWPGLDRAGEGGPNAEAIDQQLPRFRDVVCAWGDFSACPAGRRQFAAALARSTVIGLYSVAGYHGNSLSLWCLGRTKSGQPIHPLARGKHRIPDGSPRIPFHPTGAAP